MLQEPTALVAEHGDVLVEPVARDARETLLHTVSFESTVLSTAVDQDRGLLFCGTQSGAIDVVDIGTQQILARCVGHSRGVLALEIAPEDGWLFSSSADSTVRVWHLATLDPVALVYPATENSGDLFCLAWCKVRLRLYIGCQDMSIQWIHLTRAAAAQPLAARMTQHLIRRTAVHVYECAGQTPQSSTLCSVPPDTAKGMAVLSVDKRDTVPSAHFGYVYALAMIPTENGHVLATGSGDESIRIWALEDEGRPELLFTLSLPTESGDGGILTLCAWLNTLVAGKQGGTIDVWDIASRTPTRTLPAHTDDVLCLRPFSAGAKRTEFFSGGADGCVSVWDRSFRRIDKWAAHRDIVQTIALFVGGAGNGCREAGPDRDERGVGAAEARTQTPPASERAGFSWLPSRPLVVTGSSDGNVRLWRVVQDVCMAGRSAEGARNAIERSAGGPVAHALGGAVRCGAAPGSTAPVSLAVLDRLTHFIRYKSVSPSPTIPASDENREDARQAAHYLKTTLMELGARDVQLLPVRNGANPMVLGTFEGQDSYVANGAPPDGSASGQRPSPAPHRTRPPRRLRCLFYGHYDCMPASGAWDSDPWELCARDGYLYGRGVSDNKGPVLAVAYAASELLHAHVLDIDVVMLVEGEQETGSRGFQECLREHKDRVGPIDVVFVCNSYWLGETRPCVTVGLRGVIQAMVRISGQRADRHSGVHGGAYREAMMDMVKLLATLTDEDGRVTLPDFYNKVRPVLPEECAQFEMIANEMQRDAAYAKRLMALWRMPSFTVHRVTNSGPVHATVIPNSVEASISVRIVPDQDLCAIEALLLEGIIHHFRQLHSTNEIEVRVFHRADWWLGSPDQPYAMALADAVEAEWGNAPMRIREGGSIPGIAILEKELGARAMHLPMGQASDHAHLPNERIRLLNLEKGQAVVRRFFRALGDRAKVEGVALPDAARSAGEV
ncbi:hypothetical protein MSPP1_003179 [Malassezia sp. CBS 17886]|nr:hypothetical protein MSPP1_003179 [Malassezia sp. CBS 17886]